MALLDYIGMSWEQFAGKPRIVSTPHLDLSWTKRKAFHPRGPFMSGLEIIYTMDRGDVYEHDSWIAYYLRCDQNGESRCVVDPHYRGRRIGPELIYQVLIRTPGLPAHTRSRTAISVRMYRQVYNRIQRDIWLSKGKD